MHVYPRELAEYVRDRWPKPGPPEVDVPDPPDPLPPLNLLEDILATCFHASLLQEEQRPIVFRLVLRDPDRFRADEGPPGSLHRLVFTDERPFEEHELRRLSPAAPADRALIGARIAASGQPRIWGVVHSGPRWIQVITGRRLTIQPLPNALIVYASAPGRLRVMCGPELIAELSGGEISSSLLDVFASEWLSALFAPFRAELYHLHLAERVRADACWAELDEDVIRVVSQLMLRRTIAAMRQVRHGGMTVILPPDMKGLVDGPEPCIRLKYAFEDDEARRRGRTLILKLMATLAAVAGRQGAPKATWKDWLLSRDDALEPLDQAVLQMGQLMADLAAVDGAVVLTHRLELLGFGGEIAGSLPAVRVVSRALDLEATAVVREPAENVGTRHRAAYRLVKAAPGAVAIVVSQDGGVRFVTERDGQVTYWRHAPAI